VKAEATGPPPPAIGSLTKVPLAQSGEVAVNVPCGTGPLKSARTVIVTGVGGEAAAAVGSVTATTPATSKTSLRMVFLLRVGEEGVSGLAFRQISTRSGS